MTFKNDSAAPPQRLSVCVYCGSREGARPAFAEAARALGTALGQQGHRLVYGGGRAGLMGLVADAALAAGGEVFGVIPRSLLDRELGHPGLTELQVVDTMHQRKQMMAEHSDAFIALPGGIGTFEELFEVWTWRHLGYHDQPLGLVNVEGYYDGLLAFVQRAVDDGFMTTTQTAMLQADADPVHLLHRLRDLLPQAGGRDDYSKI